MVNYLLDDYRIIVVFFIEEYQPVLISEDFIWKIM